MADIREVSPDEAADVAAFIRRGFHDVAERFFLTRDLCPTFVAHITTEILREDFGKGWRYFYLEDQAQPCGCVGLGVKGGIGTMEPLVVLPEYRRRGFGRQLVDHVKNEAWRLHLRWLDISTVANNFALCEWYRKLGFENRGTCHFNDLPFTIRWMTFKVT